MNEIIEPSGTSPEQINQAEIREIEGGFEISIPHVELDSENEPGVKLEIELEKLPIQITEGTIIGTPNGVIVDAESSSSPKLKEMVEKAKELRTLPEVERPRQIMEIIRAKVNYAYDEVVKELRQTNPELADWVVKHAGIYSGGEIKASEIAESGYGVCRHLGALAVILAKEAGLEASFETSIIRKKEDGFRNVVRRDNVRPLFRNFKPGEGFSEAHAWAEFKLPDGRWMPMDPATKLVGDNDQELETFREANYKSNPINSLCFENLPANVSPMDNQDLEFKPEESSHSGALAVNCQQRLTKGVRAPQSYSGPLNFQIISQPTTEGMNVRVKSVKVIL
ncbi:MAG: transglutaminase-like domain-containing protein [Candidatus Berkelbacteria bacterium]|nr:transglutaminase-like domain-containing protein [Candidatus Berkelbacteria bacterium]